MLWNAFISVLTIRDKAISGMMAVHTREMEKREKMISHLKEVIKSKLLIACVRGTLRLRHATTIDIEIHMGGEIPILETLHVLTAK